MTLRLFADPVLRDLSRLLEQRRQDIGLTPRALARYLQRLEDLDLLQERVGASTPTTTATAPTHVNARKGVR